MTYQINRGPSVPLNFKIHEKIWNGKKVNLFFFNTCYIFYVHIDATTRSKLDLKSKNCFFIGYGGIEFGYHF